MLPQGNGLATMQCRIKVNQASHRMYSLARMARVSPTRHHNPPPCRFNKSQPITGGASCLAHWRGILEASWREASPPIDWPGDIAIAREISAIKENPIKSSEREE